MHKPLDANAILRFLLNDIPEQANATANVIYYGAFTKEAVIAEVVYVLSGVYKYDRNEIVEKILLLLELIEIENKEVVDFALNLFKSRSLDFVDCLLIGYKKVSGIDVFSFDKKLNKMLSE